MIPGRASSGAAPGTAERLGYLFPLLLVWLAFEFGRPSHPFGIPLLISVVMLVSWVVNKDKQWSQQGIWWFVLLSTSALGVAFAVNTYSAFWHTRDMAVLFLTICLPLQSQVTSVKRIRWWVYSFLAVATYVGAFAATHGGYGPSGAGGGQDENYVAALMGMAVPFAYFSLFFEKRLSVRLALIAAIVIFVAAIALGNNPSRGGFIGLCVVGLYCLARSPRKGLGLGLLAIVGIALVIVAGPSFWAEIGTTGDFQSGTGDIRLEIWKAGLRMWAANPLFGVGAGNFIWEVGNYQSAAQMAKFGHSLSGTIIAHSFFVECLAELGLVGSVAAAVLVWRNWVGLGAVRRESSVKSGDFQVDADRLQLCCFADAIRASMLAILTNGLFLSLFYYSHLWLLVAVGSALPFVSRRLNGPGGHSPQRPASTRPAHFRSRGSVPTRPALSAIAPGLIEDVRT